MHPKFDGVIAFNCSKCDLVFGVGEEARQANCPLCNKKAEVIGEGMMMFFPYSEQNIVNYVSENTEQSEYPSILKAEHIAEIVGISTRAAYNLMEESNFPLIRIGRTKRVNRDKFFKWLNQEH